MRTIKLYLLEDYKNGRKRYLISSQDEQKKELYDLTFFKGTYKQAVERMKIIKQKLDRMYCIK